MKNFLDSLFAGAVAAAAVLMVGGLSQTSQAVAMATFFIFGAIIAWGNEIVDKLDSLKTAPPTPKETPASFEG